MWHEARRQEKQLRAKMVDGSKRAERRKKYFENIRKEPDQFMQIHGTKVTIHTDRNIARVAEDSNILRAWQGDKAVLIDRFDVRSHLDNIEPVEEELQLTEKEKKEELICNFERYRVLIMNEFKDIHEKVALKHIAEKEFWFTTQSEEQWKNEFDKRKKSTESRTSIGFMYPSSDTVRAQNAEEESSEEEFLTEEIDADLDIYLYSADSQKKCNKIGESYGVVDSHFCMLFKADQQAQKTASELKRIDRQKASLVVCLELILHFFKGKDAKSDRQLLKQERAILIANAKQEEALVTLSSFAKKSKSGKETDESSSSSSEEEPSQLEFIIKFGDDETSSKPTRDSPTPERKSDRNRSRKRSRSSSLNRRRRKSSTPERKRKRHRSRKRSRNRNRKRSKERKYSSRSCRSRSKERRSMSRSRDRKRRQRSSSSSRSQSRSRSKNNKCVYSKNDDEIKFHDPAIKKDTSDDEGPTTLLEIRSSMSESEKERIEIENRKRRVRRTKKLVRSKPHPSKWEKQEKSEELETKREEAQAIKKKMKKALKATMEELKEEEEEKRKEVERERRVREELIYIEQQERRMREVKKLDEIRKADLSRAIQNARVRAEHTRLRQSSSSSYED